MAVETAARMVPWPRARADYDEGGGVAEGAAGGEAPDAAGALWPSVVAGRPSGGAAGSLTVNVVPRPMVLAAVTVPPWAVTIAATIDRPSPAPPCSRDRLGSDR